HPVCADRAGEGERGKVQRHFLRQFAKPRLLTQRRLVGIRVRAGLLDDVWRGDRSVREQISEESTRRVGVDQRPEILRGEVIAYEERPAGTAERQQRDDRQETRSASDSERRAQGESPDIHALPTLPSAAHGAKFVERHSPCAFTELVRRPGISQWSIPEYVAHNSADEEGGMAAIDWANVQQRLEWEATPPRSPNSVPIDAVRRT